ncbi:hypothetical protein [Leuconostoc mesenteroides]|nr:hypothetical protein [Leuconostoc mesenteroides]
MGRFLNVADSFRNLNFPEVVNLTHVSTNSYPGVAIILFILGLLV